MYCHNCGKEVSENDAFCASCGASIGSSGPNRIAQVDKGSAGWTVLGFFFPLVGLILYLVWKDEKPVSSKQAGTGALYGVIVSAAMAILSLIIGLIITSVLIGAGAAIIG